MLDFFTGGKIGLIHDNDGSKVDERLSPVDSRIETLLHSYDSSPQLPGVRSGSPGADGALQELRCHDIEGRASATRTGLQLWQADL